MTIESKNHYKTLQVDPAAEYEVIVAAFRRLALKYHPDTNKSPNAKQRMQEMNLAFEILSDSRKRALYDAERSSQNAKPKKAEQKAAKPDSKVIARDGNFMAYANGVVYDENTGLEWFVGPDRDTTWYEAERWVKSLNVAGDGWHMPTREELKTLYVEKHMSYLENITPLLKTTGRWIWSGETKREYVWGHPVRLSEHTGEIERYTGDMLLARYLAWEIGPKDFDESYDADGYWGSLDSHNGLQGFAVRFRR